MVTDVRYDGSKDGIVDIDDDDCDEDDDNEEEVDGFDITGFSIQMVTGGGKNPENISVGG